MKLKRNLLKILLSIVLLNLSCNIPDKNSEKKKNVEKIESIKGSTKIHYPFSKAKTVEIISYPDRMMWDTNRVSNKSLGAYINNGVILNGKLRIRKSKIKDHIILNTDQIKELSEILYDFQCTSPTEAACFEPRHSFVFFDEKQNAFAAIEICLECLTTERTEGIDYINLCDEKISKLKKYLSHVGVKYIQDKN